LAKSTTACVERVAQPSAEAVMAMTARRPGALLSLAMASYKASFKQAGLPD
jgi:hypothetical protein